MENFVWFLVGLFTDKILGWFHNRTKIEISSSLCSQGEDWWIQVKLTNRSNVPLLPSQLGISFTPGFIWWMAVPSSSLGTNESFDFKIPIDGDRNLDKLANLNAVLKLKLVYGDKIWFENERLGSLLVESFYGLSKLKLDREAQAVHLFDTPEFDLISRAKHRSLSMDLALQAYLIRYRFIVNRWPWIHKALYPFRLVWMLFFFIFQKLRTWTHKFMTLLHQCEDFCNKTEFLWWEEIFGKSK